MSYRPHDSFVAPARPRSAPWRTAFGYVLIMAFELGMIYLLFGLLSSMIGQQDAFSAFRNVFIQPETSRDTLLLLVSFLLLAGGTVVVTVQLHHRSPVTLIGPLPRAAQDFRRSIRALAGLVAVLWVLLPQGESLLPNLSFWHWVLLLPLALPALLIQTGTEELLFRGYLQQQLAARGTPVLIWMGLPAALFAWGHYDPETAGPNANMMVAWAAAFSIAAADLTARTGNLGAAIALHFANNAMAILLVATPGIASGLSLYLYPDPLNEPFTIGEMAVEFAVLGVMWLTARLGLRV